MTICFSVYNVNTLRTLVISVFTYIHYQLSNIGRFIGDLKMTATYAECYEQRLIDAECYCDDDRGIICHLHME